jgi:prophage regulatory protein
MFDRLRIDPGHRTLGELLQDRQWAVQKISRLQEEVARLKASQGAPARRSNANHNAPPSDPNDPIIGRRLLRLEDVKKLIGFSRSTIYNLISEGRFPDRIHVGPRAVRWREADIVAWQNRPGKVDEE